MRKNNLDEMQEQKMLCIESKGFWVSFWGLLILAAVQALINGSIMQIAGELIIFFIMCVYIVTACLRNGLYDRKLEPNLRTNLLVSLLAGLAILLFEFFFLRMRITDMHKVVTLSLILGGFTALLCFISISILGKIFQKRQQKLEQE